MAKSDGIWFESMTYQELFASLRTACREEHTAYLDYLESRYFQPRD